MEDIDFIKWAERQAQDFDPEKMGHVSIKWTSPCGVALSPDRADLEMKLITAGYGRDPVAEFYAARFTNGRGEIVWKWEFSHIHYDL